ncbi:sulfurtransferase TusA family protein [Caldisalinibacter kiritimatiensis]|uniref:UPF0033 domain-containing protein n=1 Tax=Caldisalinibacter kiritimatiensis TaxID=1304284 RepID=R1CET4_9FIRM|nr:sulfurtransferase TusA family protein [Caldisalinibacter kiritimatiensis]EOD00820.1 hypothetical protein L21TH_1133 [Caldisalinibacter kiritimatiensis]
MKKIDCLGDVCPIPVIKAKKELHNMKSGESFMIVTDHSCTLESLVELLKKYDVEYNVDEVINGVWEITITKC